MSAEKLFEGDKRCETVFVALKKELYERGKGLPIPSVIGILEMLKIDVLDGSK